MKAVVRIDAAPGFEDSVEDAVGATSGVVRVMPDNEGNYDLVAALRAEDANAMQDLENELRQESGVVGLTEVDDPSTELVKRLRDA